MTAAAAAAQPPKPTPPNFVLFLADDLGYGDVEINGASVNRTPNLARLAAEGVRLTSFYAAGNWCMPTRASILTASYPRRVGLDQGSDALSPDARSARGLAAAEITLPELLRSAGYATALAGKWHLGDQPDLLPTRHGFDRFFGLLHPNDGGREGFLRWGAMRRDTGYFPLALMRGETVIEAEPDQGLLTRRYTDEAIRFIEASRDRPFFLFLSYSMPHKPAHASPAFAGRSRGGVYGDAVEEIDASVGDVLSTLERLGLDSRTLVVFTSDNGAGRGWGSNAPLRGWKKTTLRGRPARAVRGSLARTHRARRELGRAGREHGPDADLRAARRRRAPERSRPRRPRRVADPRRRGRARARRATASSTTTADASKGCATGDGSCGSGAWRLRERVRRASARLRAPRRSLPCSTISTPTSPRPPTFPTSIPTSSSASKRSPLPRAAISATTPPA